MHWHAYQWTGAGADRENEAERRPGSPDFPTLPAATDADRGLAAQGGVPDRVDVRRGTAGGGRDGRRVRHGTRGTAVARCDPAPGPAGNGRSGSGIASGDSSAERALSYSSA